MGRRIDFFISAIPRGQARARHTSVNGFSRTYKTKEQQADERTLEALMMPYRPDEPLEGPLFLTVKIYMAIPQSKSGKWKEKLKEGFIRPTTKPDLSNVIKHIEDILQRMRFFADDKQIVSLVAQKVYRDEPGYYVVLEELL